MKSVGEVMAIGRTFAESLQKALRGLETGLTGLDEVAIPGLGQGDDKNAIRAALGKPTPNRFVACAQAMRLGLTVEEINAVCHIDPWFLRQLEAIVAAEDEVKAKGVPTSAGRCAGSRRWDSPMHALRTLSGRMKPRSARYGTRPASRRSSSA